MLPLSFFSSFLFYSILMPSGSISILWLYVCISCHSIFRSSIYWSHNNSFVINIYIYIQYISSCYIFYSAAFFFCHQQRQYQYINIKKKHVFLRFLFISLYLSLSFCMMCAHDHCVPSRQKIIDSRYKHKTVNVPIITRSL